MGLPPAYHAVAGGVEGNGTATPLPPPPVEDPSRGSSTDEFIPLDAGEEGEAAGRAPPDREEGEVPSPVPAKPVPAPPSGPVFPGVNGAIPAGADPAA